MSQEAEEGAEEKEPKKKITEKILMRTFGNHSLSNSSAVIWLSLEVSVDLQIHTYGFVHKQQGMRGCGHKPRS